MEKTNTEGFSVANTPSILLTERMVEIQIVIQRPLPRDVAIHFGKANTAVSPRTVTHLVSQKKEDY